MKAIAVVLCGLVLLCSPGVVLAQGEGMSDEGTKTPLGVEARSGKLVFESADKEFQWWIDSRIQIDGAMYFENKNAMSNGTIMRRATLALKSILWKDWQAEIDMDFGDAVLDARDIWIRYNFRDVNLALQVGNFKEPFGLERLNSSRLLTFLERSTVTNAIALGRRMGFAARYWTDYGQVTLGVFGHELGTKVDKGTLDEGFSTNARLTLAPVNNKRETIHLGLAASYKTPDVTPDLAPNTIEINTRTETYVNDLKALHSGDITDVNYYTRIGGELGGVYGPLYVQGEVMATQVKRWYGKPSANFAGGYGTISYMLTGESRVYYVDEGEFGPVDKPASPWGALEVAARYSILSLNDLDAGIRGGKCNQMMFGINWYPNMNFKIQLNFSSVKLDDNATSKGRLNPGDSYSFMQMRFQASL
ncbi:MAG: oprO-OprP [Bacteroidetes bacterium]|nr:oprO-OprP [Bacteroidota bacterium]